jgi:hypothetical protein
MEVKAVIHQLLRRVNYFCRSRQLFLPVGHQGYRYSLSSIVIH